MPALDSGASLPNAVEMVSFFLDGEFLLRKRRVTVVGSLWANGEGGRERERERERREKLRDL